MTTDVQLRVNGLWLAGSGLPFGDLTWTDRADGGNFEASWSVELPFGSRPGALFRGSVAEIFVGPMRRWYGEVDVCDWAAGTFSATGMSQRAYDFSARNGGGQTSSTPDVVIANSIANDEWRVTLPGSFQSSPVVLGDGTTQQNTVGAILDQAATTSGRRWGVWGDGIVRAYVPNAAYDYLLTPGVLELGETTEDRFSSVIFGYIDSADGVTKWDGVTGPERPISHHQEDLTRLGPISTAVALTIAANILALGASSAGWTNSVDVTSAQLLTAGGAPADLSSVTAGQTVRTFVIGDQGRQYRDLVIGETKYAAGSDVLNMSPVGKVASNLSEVIEDTYTRITGLPVAS